MAHDTGSSPRGQRLLALAAVCALAVATAAAFGRVFSGGGSVLRLMGVGLGSALLAAALERRNLVLATLVSAAGLLIVVGIVVFPKTTLFGLPTIDTLRAIREAAGQIGAEADAQVAPTPPLAPLFLAAVTALWAAVFSAHALAIRAGSPLLSLLPPVALVAFADTVLEESERPLYGVLFLATALIIVFIDGLRRVQRWGPAWVWPGARGGLTSATGRGARRVAAMALGVATLVPLTLPGFGTGAVIDLSGSGSGDAIRVNPLVSIQSNLNRSDPVELFTVDSSIGTYWRTVGLDTFDGVTWKATEGSALQEVASTTPLSGERLFAQDLDQTFTVGAENVTLSGLPVVYPARHVEYPGSLTYDPDLETLHLDGAIDAGTAYRVQSSPVQPPPAVLEAVQFPDPLLNPRYTSIPAGLDQIHAIAEQWVANETTDYSKILAIQDHLRGPEFRYDETVPARADQFTLLDFLQTTKRGFCQQYASAMAVMLRTLGYPARVAVGFTSGDQSDADGLWHVTTDNAHAWVEVLFPTYGWLSFEPTPGPTNPIAATYNDPVKVCVNDLGQQVSCAGANGPVRGGQNGPPQNQRIRRVDDLGTVNGGSLPPGGSGPGVIAPEPFRFPTGLAAAVVGVLALLVLALTPPVRALRRRARLRRAGPDPRARILATYDVFASKAGAMGWARRLGETLQEYRRRLDASGFLDGDHLLRLTGLAGRAAYASQDPAPADAAEATQAAETALRDLQRGTPLGRRILGWYLPERPAD